DALRGHRRHVGAHAVQAVLTDAAVRRLLAGRGALPVRAGAPGAALTRERARHQRAGAAGVVAGVAAAVGAGVARRALCVRVARLAAHALDAHAADAVGVGG